MPHFGINQRSFPLPKVFALRRNGVRIAPFYCALNTVLLCGLRRIMQAFANEEIPEDFMHEAQRRPSGILVAYQKKSVERYISLDEKLSTILPKVKGKLTPKGSKVWTDYVLLRRLRDRLVHLKSIDRAHSKADNLFPKSIWSELLAPKQPNFPLIAKKMMLHFFDENNSYHWLRNCPF